MTSHIAAIVVFGDPFMGQAFKGVSGSIVHTECDEKDLVCKGLPLPIGAHNEYNETSKMNRVVEWIVHTIGNV